MAGIVSPSSAATSDVDEGVKAEIAEVLERYNQFTLFFHQCDGAYEYSEGVQYLLSWSYYGFPNLGNYVPMYRVTDERYNSKEKVQVLLDSIFDDNLSSFLFEVLFTGTFCQRCKVLTYYGQYAMKYFEIDGYMYGYTPKTDTMLWLRYINTDSIEVIEENGRLFVTASGASEYKSSRVCENDSIIKMVFDRVDGELRISNVITSKTDDKISDDMETIANTMLDRIDYYYESLHILPESDTIYVCQFDEVAYSSYWDKKYRTRGKKVNDDKIKNTVDFFDVLSNTFSFIDSVCIYYRLIYGDISEIAHSKPYYGYYDGALFQPDYYPSVRKPFNREHMTIWNEGEKIVVKLETYDELFETNKYYYITMENLFSSADPEYRIIKH